MCGGTTYKSVMEQYITGLENRYKSRVINFSVRYKKYGWAPIYLRAEFENKKFIQYLFIILNLVMPSII